MIKQIFARTDAKYSATGLKRRVKLCLFQLSRERCYAYVFWELRQTSHIFVTVSQINILIFEKCSTFTYLKRFVILLEFWRLLEGKTQNYQCYTKG